MASKNCDGVDFGLDLTRVYEYAEVCEIFTRHLWKLSIILSIEVATIINTESCGNNELKFFKFTKDAAGQLHITEVTDFDSINVNDIVAPPPAEGPISYTKAVKIAFDTATPDSRARQFAEVLNDAKQYADEAGQPITVFAQFKVKPSGELTFDCPIEYKPKVKGWEMQAILRDKFKVHAFKGKAYYSLTKEQCREALRLIRSGNTDLFKFKN